MKSLEMHCITGIGLFLAWNCPLVLVALSAHRVTDEESRNNIILAIAQVSAVGAIAIAVRESLHFFNCIPERRSRRDDTSTDETDARSLRRKARRVLMRGSEDRLRTTLEYLALALLISGACASPDNIWWVALCVLPLSEMVVWIYAGLERNSRIQSGSLRQGDVTG